MRRRELLVSAAAEAERLKRLIESNTTGYNMEEVIASTAFQLLIAQGINRSRIAQSSATTRLIHDDPSAETIITTPQLKKAVTDLSIVLAELDPKRRAEVTLLDFADRAILNDIQGKEHYKMPPDEKPRLGRPPGSKNKPK